MGSFLLAAWLGACSADAVTTTYALKHGGREIIIPTQNSLAINAIIAGQAAAGTISVSYIAKKGHPKTARLIGWTLVALRATAVGWNLYQNTIR